MKLVQKGTGVILSSRLRNALFVLFIGGILAYGAGFAWYMLSRFDLINLISNTYDDAFYYFQIARNLAEGKFSTFDGGLTRTNGYHPLWLFLITPFYWVFDKETALFAIKALEIMLVAGGVALVTAAARLARLPWVLMFAALPMLYQQHQQYWLLLGMEAAAALFMLGLFVLTVCLFARSPARWKWPLAAVAFALPWVRLEYIAISLATTGALCLIEWSWQDRPSGASFGERARSALSFKSIVPLLAAGAGILVYFAYNRLVFGGIVPVSGAVKQMLSQRLWEREGGYNFVQNFRDVLQIPVFNDGLLVALEVCAYLLLVWWLARSSRSRKDWLLLAFLAGVSGLAAGHLAKFAQTVLTAHPNWGSDAWYFVPAYLMTVLIVPVRCWVVVFFIRWFIGSKSRHWANVLSLGVVVVGAVFLLARVNFTSPFRWVEASSASARITSPWHMAVYGGTQLMNRVLPEDSVVGSWDAGLIAYFSRFPVVNLDGLVNSYDYFHAMNVAGDDWYDELIPSYRKFGTTHFANLPGWDLSGEVLFEGSLRAWNEKEDVFYLWPIDPLEDAAAAWIWKRMEPHFDYQSHGAGSFVDGRLVQTFARECDPNELVVWRWAGPGDGTVARVWTQTRTGLCVTIAVLPLTVSSPVRFETMPRSDYPTWLTGGSTPVIRSDWDVFLVEDSLVYAKDQCSPEDAEPTFFVHLIPVDMNDLPGHRKQHGFDGFNFYFRNHLLVGRGVCVARRELPDNAYAVAAVRTGQFTGEGETIWEGSFEIVEPADEGKIAR